MKRPILKVITIFLMTCFISTSMAMTLPTVEAIQAFFRDVHLQFNNAPPIASRVIVHNDRIYLPIRFIAEQLGANVYWNEAENTVSIQSTQSLQDFPEADPLSHERFAYGEILAIDQANHHITIQEHYDDRDIYIEPNLQVNEDVIIILQRNDKRMNLSFSDLKIGDYVGLVLTKNQQVRGIILNQ